MKCRFNGERRGKTVSLKGKQNEAFEYHLFGWFVPLGRMCSPWENDVELPGERYATAGS